MRKIVVAVVVALALAAGGVYWWSGRPLHLSHPVVDLQVHTGDGPDEISRAAVAGGVQVSPEVLKWWLRLGSRTTGFKAGPYEVRRGDSLRSLLRRLMRGEFAMRKVRLGEGWNFRQVRAALAAADALQPGQTVEVLTPVLPAPLLEALALRGLHWRAEPCSDGGICVAILCPNG